MGTARAPVVGSGTAPAWIWRVSKPHSGMAGLPGSDPGTTSAGAGIMKSDANSYNPDLVSQLSGSGTTKGGASGVGPRRRCPDRCGSLSPPQHPTTAPWRPLAAGAPIASGRSLSEPGVGPKAADAQVRTVCRLERQGIGRWCADPGEGVAVD